MCTFIILSDRIAYCMYLYLMRTFFFRNFRSKKSGVDDTRKKSSQLCDIIHTIIMFLHFDVNDVLMTAAFENLTTKTGSALRFLFQLKNKTKKKTA